MEKEEEVDRKRAGKKILKSGQGWTLPAVDRTRWNGLFRRHLLFLNGLARLWD